MDDKLGGIPNAFYDLIVFSSTTVLFATGMFFGLGQHYSNWYMQMGTANVVLLLLALLFLSYEYGRIAEAWSAAIVQMPLQYVSKHTRFLKNPDFLLPLDGAEAALGLNSPKRLRTGGKWAVYFYALAVNQIIGTDLLKRYAWEKLSRNSAFSYFLLFSLSLFVGICQCFTTISVTSPGTWTFGTLEYSATAGLLMIVTYIEYYRRNCWNNDLLERVIPVLAKAATLGKSRKGDSDQSKT